MYLFAVQAWRTSSHHVSMNWLFVILFLLDRIECIETQFLPPLDRTQFIDKGVAAKDHKEAAVPYKLRLVCGHGLPTQQRVPASIGMYYVGVGIRSAVVVVALDSGGGGLFWQ